MTKTKGAIMTIEEEIRERGKEAGPEMTEADFYETLNNESWQVKGATC